MSKVDLDFIFGNEKVKLDCSNCNHKFQIKWKQVFTDDKKIICPRCREDNIDKLDSKAKRTLKSLEKTIESYGKNLKKFL